MLRPRSIVVSFCSNVKPGRLLLNPTRHYSDKQIVPLDREDVPITAWNPYIGTGRTRPYIGREGRSSSTGRIVTVFGATGFLGRYIVHILAKLGNTIVVPFDGDDEDIRFLRVMGDLGQIIPMRFDLESPKEILECVKDSHVVINAISREHDTLRFTMDHVNVEGCARIAEACRWTKVPAFIHVSDMRASPKANNRYLQTKYAGEQAVLSKYPSTCIVRTSNLYGYEDRFTFMLGLLANKGFGFPVLKGHVGTQLYPLYVADAALGIKYILEDDSIYDQDSSSGRPVPYYELFGDELYTFAKLADLFTKNTLKDLPVREMRLWQYRFLGLSSLLWRKPMFKHDQVLTLHSDERPLSSQQSEKTIYDMDGHMRILNYKTMQNVAGMPPLRRFEDMAIQFLRRFRSGEDYEIPSDYKHPLFKSAE